MKNDAMNYQLTETSKEFYGIKNIECPICDKPNNITPIGIVKLGKIGYCIDCYFKHILIKQ